MKALLILPAIMIMVLGFAIELQAIAEDASEKSLRFAEDMSNAIPCAAKGLPVTECSPNLLEHDFTAEVEAFEQVLGEINETMAPLQEQLLMELGEGIEVEDITFTCRFNEKTQELTCSI